MRESENGTNESIQAPELADDNISRLGAAGAIDVSTAKAITFDADAVDAHLNLGSTLDSSKYLKLNGGDSFAVKDTTSAIYVNKACGYLLDEDVTP